LPLGHELYVGMPEGEVNPDLCVSQVQPIRCSWSWHSRAANKSSAIK
jgi:hypothetical protein